jgi:hypothetical protein
MPRLRLLALLPVLAAPGLFPAAAVASGLDVWLQGTVTTPAGTPLAGAEIRVHAEGAEEAIAAVCNRRGRYRVLLRQADREVLMTASAPGHQTVVTRARPLRLPEEHERRGFSQGGGRGTFEVDFVLPSEEEVVERARADGGRGAVPPEELRHAARVLQGRGVAVARAGALALAEDLFRESLQLDPDLEGAHAGLVSALFEQGRLEDLDTAAAAAWKLGIRHPEVARLHCEALDRLGRERELAAALEDLRQVDPEAAADFRRHRGTAGDAGGAPPERR